MNAPAGLFDAYDLIAKHIGNGENPSSLPFGPILTIQPAFAVVFAVALLCAGQTASITATLAGQIVSEGFIEWRVSVSFVVVQCYAHANVRHNSRSYDD